MTDHAGTWGADARRLLTLKQAWAVLAGEAAPLGGESVPLLRAAGRVLVAPVVADDDYPAFDKAMMDGFAVRSADCAVADARLTVLGLTAAGEVPRAALGPRQAMQINTGAPVPAGADAVVRVEETRVEGGEVIIRKPALPEQNISRRGSDRRKGEIVLAPPLRMGPAQIAAAATAGAAEVAVARPVGVAIVATGDELVPVGGPRKAGCIHESNGPMLSALVCDFGGEPVDVGIVGDDAAMLRERFARALTQPVVVAVGGMSMGTLDLVPVALQSLGVRWRFHGVDMRPGKPVAYGRGPQGQHVFGLPGNPASAFVCAHLFVRMVVEALQGLPARPPVTVRAVLAVDLRAGRDPRPAYVPARVWSDPQRGLVCAPCRWSGSGDPFGLAEANALLVRGSPTEDVCAGSAAEVTLTGPISAAADACPPGAV